MICGCIDIGTNTTRLLVAEVAGGRVEPVAAERVFTRVGGAIDGAGSIDPAKVAEVAEVAGRHAEAARAAGCERLLAVGTAAVREAPNAARLAAAVEAATGLELAVLGGEQEARLSFAGATRSLAPGGDPVAVADVGGGSTELAVGVPGAEATWWASIPVGSGVMADQCLRSDPPTAAEIGELRAWVSSALAEVRIPPVAAALAVGGTAASLTRLVGGALTAAALHRALDVLTGMPCADAAEHFGIDPIRVRLLPAGIAVLQGVSERLDLELAIAGGGLREGVVLALAEGSL